MGNIPTQMCDRLNVMGINVLVCEIPSQAYGDCNKSDYGLALLKNPHRVDRRHYKVIFCQNDVSTSFWRNNDVIIASSSRWADFNPTCR